MRDLKVGSWYLHPECPEQIEYRYHVLQVEGDEVLVSDFAGQRRRLTIGEFEDFVEVTDGTGSGVSDEENAALNHREAT